MKMLMASAIFFLGSFAFSSQIDDAAAVKKEHFHPEAPEELRQFAFWLGEWEYTGKTLQQDGSWKEGSGTNTITVTLDGYALEENFHAIKPNSWSGMSITVYNTQAGKFYQQWVDTQGQRFLPFEGGMEGDSMVLYSPEREIQGTSVINKMVFKDIQADSFTWSYEMSRDGGKTWQARWVINYKRLK